MASVLVPAYYCCTTIAGWGGFTHRVFYVEREKRLISQVSSCQPLCKQHQHHACAQWRAGGGFKPNALREPFQDFLGMDLLTRHAPRTTSATSCQNHMETSATESLGLMCSPMATSSLTCPSSLPSILPFPQQ